ncbi:MAG TPA: hypothetical protein VJL34_13605 [Anaerolineales bacterium]|nr:hypothetical protein [Anaerolineales bacterium]
MRLPGKIDQPRRAAELLKLPAFGLRSRFARLGIPLRVEPQINPPQIVPEPGPVPP